MGQAAIKPSVAVGRLLRSRRHEHGLTLRQVSDRMAERGDRIPPSTLARIEQGKLDPGVRRLHMLLRMYEVPAHLVADLAELDSLAVHEPPSGDRESLYQQGLDSWRRGDIACGLACMMAVREHSADDDSSRVLRQRALLAFAIAARNLAKVQLARQIVDDLLCEPVHRSLESKALILAASLWCAQGSPLVARALLQQAKSGIGPDDHELAALVLHQEGKVLQTQGDLDGADRSVGQAIGRYARIRDTYNEARARLLRVGILEQRRQIDEALRCAADVVVFCEEHDHARVLLGARLEYGRLKVRHESVSEGLKLLEQGLGQAVMLGDRNAEFNAHYLLWKACQLSGDLERARRELESARYCARYVDDFSDESEEVRAAASAADEA